MVKAGAWLSHSASFTGLGFKLTTCLHCQSTNSRSIQESNHVRFCCFWNFVLLSESNLYWYIFASLFPQRRCFILETWSAMWTRVMATWRFGFGEQGQICPRQERLQCAREKLTLFQLKVCDFKQWTKSKYDPVFVLVMFW